MRARPSPECSLQAPFLQSLLQAGHVLARDDDVFAVLQVHDELILDCPPEEEERVSEIVCDCMQNAMQLCVPLIAEVKSGQSWYDTK